MTSRQSQRRRATRIGALYALGVLIGYIALLGLADRIANG